MNRICVLSSLLVFGCGGVVSGGGNDGGTGANGVSEGGNRWWVDASDPAPPCDWIQPNATGVWVAFDSARNAGNRDLFVIRGDATGLRQLTNDAAEDREPAFSPDGTKLAFTTDRDGTPQIWIMDLKTGIASELTHQPQGAEQAAWSFDARQIAYHAIKTNAVYTIGVDGTGDALYASSGLPPYNTYKNPAFTPSGELAVDRNNEIDVFRAQHWVGQPVNNWPTTIEQPTVSPDAPLLACAIVCGLEPRESVWIAELNGVVIPCKEGTRLTHVCAGNARAPSWGMDDYLAYEHTYGAPSENVWYIILKKRGEAGEANLTRTTRGGTSRNPSVSLSPTIALP